MKGVRSILKVFTTMKNIVSGLQLFAAILNNDGTVSVKEKESY